MGKAQSRAPRIASKRKDAKASALANLAKALNICAEAGLEPKLKHGIVYTGYGYVLPLADGKWTARTLTYSEFSVPEDDWDS